MWILVNEEWFRVLKAILIQSVKVQTAGEVVHWYVEVTCINLNWVLLLFGTALGSAYVQA